MKKYYVVYREGAQEVFLHETGEEAENDAFEWLDYLVEENMVDGDPEILIGQVKPIVRVAYERKRVREVIPTDPAETDPST